MNYVISWMTVGLADSNQPSSELHNSQVNPWVKNLVNKTLSVINKHFLRREVTNRMSTNAEGTWQLLVTVRIMVEIINIPWRVIRIIMTMYLGGKHKLCTKFASHHVPVSHAVAYSSWYILYLSCITRL